MVRVCALLVVDVTVSVAKAGFADANTPVTSLYVQGERISVVSMTLVV